MQADEYDKTGIKLLLLPGREPSGLRSIPLWRDGWRVPWLYMYWSLFNTFLLRYRVYSKINANVLTESDLNFLV